jgi:hypothetical protein
MVQKQVYYQYKHLVLIPPENIQDLYGLLMLSRLVHAFYATPHDHRCAKYFEGHIVNIVHVNENFGETKLKNYATVGENMPLWSFYMLLRHPALCYARPHNHRYAKYCQGQNVKILHLNIKFGQN